MLVRWLDVVLCICSTFITYLMSYPLMSNILLTASKSSFMFSLSAITFTLLKISWLVGLYFNYLYIKLLLELQMIYMIDEALQFSVPPIISDAHYRNLSFLDYLNKCTYTTSVISRHSIDFIHQNKHARVLFRVYRGVSIYWSACAHVLQQTLNRFLRSVIACIKLNKMVI